MKNSCNVAKVFVLVFTVILFAGFLSLPMHLNAASPVQLTVSDATGKAGEEITISITISPNSGLGAAGMLLKYDASKLKYENHEIGAGAAGGMSVANPNYKTEGDFENIYQAYINATGLVASGSMLNVKFTIKSGWSGETPLVLTVKEFNDASNEYKDIAYNIKNGKITMSAATPTDSSVTSTTLATTKPTTTRTEQVTNEDGVKVTETDKSGSTVYKTTVVYETQTRTEFVTNDDGSKIVETDEAGSTAYKTTVIHEKVIRSEYITQEGGSKVFVTDEDGSTVYKTTLIYETINDEDSQGESKDIDDDKTTDSVSTAKKTVVIVALVCGLLLAAALIAIVYKKKKSTVE